MREIKFKVWDNIDYMSKPFSVDDVVSRLVEFTPECVLLISTGLKDKNRDDIFEGDVLEIKNPRAGNKNQRRLVEWVDDRGKTALNYNCVGGIGFRFTPLRKGLGNDTVFEPFETEIVGNIYQNPEILNSSDMFPLDKR